MKIAIRSNTNISKADTRIHIHAKKHTYDQVHIIIRIILT